MELLLTLFVVLIVFGPKKLPMLAQHLGKVVALANRYKHRALSLWQQQLQEQQFIENQKKAAIGDALYEKHNSD